MLTNQCNEQGNPEGLWERYFSNGQLDYRGLYINGKKDGLWERYYKNGQLDNKGFYKNEIRIGYSESYYSTGELCCKGLFNNDSKSIGFWKEAFGMAKSIRNVFYVD